MATEPTKWNESTEMTVHCIGCGRESPRQEMPSPFCPNCAHDVRCMAYWRTIKSWHIENAVKAKDEEIVKLTTACSTTMLQASDWKRAADEIEAELRSTAKAVLPWVRDFAGDQPACAAFVEMFEDKEPVK